MSESKPWELLGFLDARAIWRHHVCGFTTPTNEEDNAPADCRICSVFRLADAAMAALKRTRVAIDECAGHAEDCASLAELGVDCTCWVEETLAELEAVEEVNDGERLLPPDDRAVLESRIAELETTSAADDARVEFVLKMVDANGHHSTNCSANSAGAVGSPFALLACDCWLRAVRHGEPIEPEPVRLVEDCLDDLTVAAKKLKASASDAKTEILRVETVLKETGIKVSAFVQVKDSFAIGWGRQPLSGRGPEWGLFYQFGDGDEAQLISAPDQILLMAVPYLDSLATRLVKSAQRLQAGFDEANSTEEDD